jgi:hypothetical protein
MTYHPVLSTPGHSSTLLPILIVDIGATASRTCVRRSRITAPGCPAVSTIRIGANHVVLIVSQMLTSPVVTSGLMLGETRIFVNKFLSTTTNVYFGCASCIVVVRWVVALSFASAAWHGLGGRELVYKVNPRNIRVNNSGVTEVSMRPLQLLI